MSFQKVHNDVTILWITVIYFNLIRKLVKYVIIWFGINTRQNSNAPHCIINLIIKRANKYLFFFLRHDKLLVDN